MRKRIIKYLLEKYKDKLWLMSGNIAERFHGKDDGAYDDLQDKLYYWITKDIEEF